MKIILKIILILSISTTILKATDDATYYCKVRTIATVKVVFSDYNNKYKNYNHVKFSGRLVPELPMLTYNPEKHLFIDKGKEKIITYNENTKILKGISYTSKKIRKYTLSKCVKKKI